MRNIYKEIREISEKRHQVVQKREQRSEREQTAVSAAGSSKQKVEGFDR
jgi:hypothetical protein